MFQIRRLWLGFLCISLVLTMAGPARADVYDENEDDAQNGAAVPLTCRSHPRLASADPALRPPVGTRMCEGFILSQVPSNPAQAPSDRFYAALDVTLSVPPGDGPFPLLGYLHSIGSNKLEGEAHERPFLEDGIAFMRYSMRGRGVSFGDDQLADEDFEIRDFQNVVEAIVERTAFGPTPPSFSFDRKRIAAGGISYGGWQTLLLGQTSRRTWPCGPDTCELKTIMPGGAPSDILYSLLPNGRPAQRADQSGYVLGIEKLSYVTTLFTGGGQHHPRYNGPSNASFYFRYSAAIAAGEPYQDPNSKAFIGPNAATLTELLRVMTLDRSPAYQDYCSEGALPIFMVQGWTDDLFTVHEAIRLRDTLDRQCGFEYPLKLYLGNVAHPRGRPLTDAVETTFAFEMVRQWLRHYLLGQTDVPAFDVTFGVTPPPGVIFDPASVFTAPEVEEVAKGAINGQLTGTITLTYNPAPFSIPDVTGDPLFETGTGSQAAPLVAATEDVHQTAGPLTGDAAVYSVAGSQLVPEGQQYRTVCGMGRVNVRGTVAGTDAQYSVRVWNVDAQRRRYLIDRGVYRFLGSPGPLDVNIPLHGNVWRIRRDARVIVEITSSDFPYLRPNNLPSVTTLSAASITMPTCETGLAAFSAPGTLESPGRPLAGTGEESHSTLGGLLALAGVLMLLLVRRNLRSQL